MPTLRVANSGLVYRNPRPALYSRHAYFPTAAELDDGTLLCAFDIGSAFEATDVRSFLSRSTDGGATWSTPWPYYQPKENDHPISTTCRMAATKDGELIGWACNFDRTREGEGLGNADTEGFCETDFFLVRSTDGGLNWSPPTKVDLPTAWRNFETCAPPFAANERGRLVVATSPWPAWDGTRSPWGHDGLAFATDDGGESWGEIVSVFPDATHRLAAFEQALTKMNDGRILAVCWTYDTVAGRSLPNRWSISSDEARTFQLPREAPIHGETCRPLGLEHDRVLFVYRRVDKPGLWAHLAVIKGDDWLPLAETALWNGLPTQQPTDRQGSIGNMSNLKFGCPCLVRRRNGEVFVVFWCVEDCVSVIRWFKIQIDE